MMTTDIITDDNFAHQSPFPSLNLSSRRSNLSRALSPEHDNESAGFGSGGPLLVTRGSAIIHVIYICIIQTLVTYNIATTQRLLKYYNGVRSCSMIYSTLPRPYHFARPLHSLSLSRGFGRASI
jgi:hypothetical protein